MLKEWQKGTTHWTLAKQNNILFIQLLQCSEILGKFTWKKMLCTKQLYCLSRKRRNTIRLSASIVFKTLLLISFMWMWKKRWKKGTHINPIQPGLWRPSSPGGGGGGCSSPPFRSRPWIAAKICIKVERDVNYKTVLLDYYLLFLLFYMSLLIMLIYATKKKKNLIFTINIIKLKLHCHHGPPPPPQSF